MSSCTSGVRRLACMTQNDGFDVVFDMLKSFFRQTFQCQLIKEEPNRTLLDRNMWLFGVKLIKQYIFKPKCSCRRKSMQEKEFVMVIRCEWKLPLLGMTVRHLE